MDAFSEDQLTQVSRQRQAAGLQTFFQRGAFVLIQPDMQIVLILPHGAPVSAYRRQWGQGSPCKPRFGTKTLCLRSCREAARA